MVEYSTKPPAPSFVSSTRLLVPDELIRSGRPSPSTSRIARAYGLGPTMGVEAITRLPQARAPPKLTDAIGTLATPEASPWKLPLNRLPGLVNWTDPVNTRLLFNRAIL